jgi:DNA-binding MarR family transcriptional regulator
LPAVPDLPALFEDLVRLEIELWDAVETRLRDELGVGLATAQVLEVVKRVEDCRVYEISRELSITVGGASKTVDRVERAGLVARKPHDTDRRSSVIELTPDGARTHAKAQRMVAAALEDLIGDALGGRAFDQLHRALVKVRAHLADQ